MAHSVTVSVYKRAFEEGFAFDEQMCCYVKEGMYYRVDGPHLIPVLGIPVPTMASRRYNSAADRYSR